jgi:Spherulation-specific family 4
MTAAHAERRSKARIVALLAACFLLAVAAAVAVGVSAVAAQGDQRQLVPAYFAPDAEGELWPATCRDMRAADGGSVAVLNPADGPGARADSRYADVVADCHEQGQKVLGYVSTRYGARPLTDVTADIDRYYADYAVDGIFVDEMAESPQDPATGQDLRAYYQQVYAHVGQRTPGTELVVGNPGVAAGTDWQLETPVADVLVVFEGSAAAYEAWTPPGWIAAHPPERFAHLVHTTPEHALARVCELAGERGAGFLYATDDSGANPWDSLPSYWDRVAPSCG